MNESISRSISAVIGKGSVNHNRRNFTAHNVDSSRSVLNHEYTFMDIRDAYHHLFDKALERYNKKQTRSDRIIQDYYEKIRTGKQEKPFYEVIIQIGNKDDMNVQSEYGKLAETILDEYMLTFQARNPNLFVYSAHLHMDEETPHLHIDFIPYTTNSKRGLDTRVSLKQALANQGFKGGTRSDTEWNQWILSEKETLAKIMEKHHVKWQQLGTHEQHLNVLDYKKKMRSQEVEELNHEINALSSTKQELQNNITSIQKQMTIIKEEEKEFQHYTKEITDDDFWNIPEPNKLMSAKSYHNKIVIPFITSIKKAINRMIKKYLALSQEVNQLKQSIFPLKMKVNELNNQIDHLIDENMEQKNIIRRIQKAIGYQAFNKILDESRNRKDKNYDKEK